MHVPTRGRIFGRSDRTRGRLETCLIFEKLVAHRALRVHHFGRVHLWEGKALDGECLLCFWLLIFPRFPSASCMTASSFTSVFEESCLCLIDCVEP